MKLSFWAPKPHAAKQAKHAHHTIRRHFLVYSALTVLLVSIVLPLLSPLQAHAIGQSNILDNGMIKATLGVKYLHGCLDSWGNWKAVNGSDIVNFKWSFGTGQAKSNFIDEGTNNGLRLDYTNNYNVIAFKDDSSAKWNYCNENWAPAVKASFASLTSDNGGQILCKMGFKQSQKKDADYGCLPSNVKWYYSGADRLSNGTGIVVDMDQLSINIDDFPAAAKGNVTFQYNGPSVIDNYANGKIITSSEALWYAYDLYMQTSGSATINSTQSSSYSIPVTIWNYDTTKNTYYTEQWYARDASAVPSKILDNNGSPSAAAKEFFSAVGAKSVADAQKTALQTQCAALFPASTASGTAAEYENEARNRKIAACVDGATIKSAGHCELTYLGQDAAGTKDTQTTYEKKYGEAIAKELKDACLNGQGVQIPSGGTTDPSDPPSDDPCAIIPANTPMPWLACSVFTAIKQITTGMQSTMTDILYTPADTLFADKSTLKNASDVFRNIGMALIVITGLIMIIAQATSLEIIDAYTIKKVLPRLGIALVGMAVAWPLLKLGVTLSNDLGFGVRDLFDKFAQTAAGPSTDSNIGTNTLAIITALVGGVGGVVAGLGIWGAVLFGASLIVAYVTGLIVLFMQKLLLILLVIIAPLAIAASVLPGTEKLWKLWRSNMLKVLAMFTVIIAIIKVGDVVAAVALASNLPLLGFGAKIATLALTFKAPQLTSQALGGLMGMASGAAYKMAGAMRSPIDNLRKQNTASRNKYYMGKAQRRASEGAVSLQRGLSKYASKDSTGAVGKFLAKRGGSSLDKMFGGWENDRNLEARMSAYQAQESKKAEDQIATGDDRHIRALTVNKSEADKTDEGDMWRRHQGRKQYKTLGGNWVDEADVDTAYKRYGHNAQFQQAALSYEMRKASSDEDVQRFSDGHTVGKLMDNWGLDRDTEQDGVWKGAAFQNQGQHLHLKHTDKNGNLNWKAYAQELHQRKSVGQMSQFSGEAIDQMKSGYDMAATAHAAALAADDKDEAAEAQQAMDYYKGTVEAFVQRYGAGAAMRPGDGEGGEMVPSPDAATPGSSVAAETVRTMTYGAADVSEKVREAALHMGLYVPHVDAASNNPNSIPLPAEADLKRRLS